MGGLTAIVLAAGLGTRMKSEIPKVLHEVLGLPMVFYPVQAALEAGAERVVVVVGHGREAVTEQLNRRFPGGRLSFVVQDEQLGTGHAVLCAWNQISWAPDEVLILYGDTPNLTANTVTRLVNQTRGTETPVGVLTACVPDPAGYGRAVRDKQGRALAIVEDRDATDAQKAINEINVGTYLFDARFLDSQIGSLSSDNDQGELYLTDLIASAAEDARHAQFVVVEDQQEVMGINSRVELAMAESVARRRRNHFLMLSGVTFIDPSHTIVGVDVEIEPDVTLGPNVHLSGATVVKRGARIEMGVFAVDSEIGPDSLVRAYSHLEGAVIRDRVQVGPFARLRPGTVLMTDSRVGNFVEVKKTIIGRGSKASHLTYLGDTVLGEGVNIGAGTITCNYDGKDKHKTVIEDGAFIGSNTQLVAPVVVGAGAIVGAGSTITKEVPPGTLALARSPQKNIEGFVERKRRGGKG